MLESVSINSNLIEGSTKYNLSEFTPSSSTSIRRASGKAGIMTVVFVETNVSVSLEKEVYERL